MRTGGIAGTPQPETDVSTSHLSNLFTKFKSSTIKELPLDLTVGCADKSEVGQDPKESHDFSFFVCFTLDSIIYLTPGHIPDISNLWDNVLHVREGECFWKSLEMSIDLETGSFFTDAPE